MRGGCCRAALIGLSLAVTAGLWLPRAVAARPASQLRFGRVESVEAKLDLMLRMDWERFQIYATDPEPRLAEKTLLGQRIGARSRGWILHPRFWRWQMTFNMLFIEDLIRGELAGVQPSLDGEPVLNTDRVEVGAEYDLRSTFLAEHATPVMLFASRGTELIERIFQSNYWLTTTSAGVTAAWHNDLFPITVRYLYLENDGEQRELRSSDEVQQVYVTGRHEGRRATLRLDYRWTDYQNRVFDTVDYSLQRGELEHLLRLDDKKRWELSSMLRSQHRINTDRTFSEARLIEALTGHLSEDLRLRLRYELAWWRWDSEDMVENLGWVELKHQLYKSLTTTLHARARHAAGDTEERVEGTLAGSLVYRKTLGPLFVMTHGYQASGTWGSLSLTGASLREIDEPVTLSGEIPARLLRAGVDLESVEITSASGARSYRRGLDFEVFSSGQATYVRRKLGGDIPEGASVLVSYTYDQGESGALSDVEQRYTGRLETSAWDWITLYGQYGYRELTRQGLTSGASEHLTTHEVWTGMEVSQWNLTSNVEYHMLAAERFTAHELSVSSTAMVPLSASFEPTFGLREAYVDIAALDEHKNSLQVFTEARVPLGRSLSASWRFNYTWELGGANDGHFLNGKARVEWRWRSLRLWLEYETRVANKDLESYGRQSLTINFRREL